MYRTTRRRFLQTGAAGAASIALPIHLARAAKKGGVMRMGKAHGQTIDSLDPATYEHGFTIALTNGYNNYLTEVAGNGSLVGQLAESWEASADAAAWTFRLRKGATYHNGREVTAEDVIASIEHHRGEDSKSAAKPILAPITGMKADGKHIVVFSLASGNADFPFILSDYHVPIVPSEGEARRTGSPASAQGRTGSRTSSRGCVSTWRSMRTTGTRGAGTSTRSR